MNLYGAPLLQSPIVGAALAIAAPTLSRIFSGLVTQWGVFDSSKNLAINPDSFFGVEAITPYTLSDAQLEQGSFSTYNKVKTPNRVTVKMATGGTVTNRTNFLTVLDQMVADLNLYTIVSPEKVWDNMNCMTYDIRREASRGAGMIMVNVMFEEVRVIQSVSYSSLVPTASQTNPTTSTGMPNPVDTAPQAHADSQIGGITAQPLPA